MVRFQHSSDPSKPVTLLDVYHEFNKNVSTNLKINNFKSRKTEKNYAFDPDIPTHSEYLEVRYSVNIIKKYNYVVLDSNYFQAKSPIIPAEFQSGETYSKIFGLNTSYLEIVLIEQKMKGPCWLEVIDPELVSNPVSWCKLEVNCVKSSNLHIVDPTKALPPPPLAVLSIHLRTIVGHGKYGVKNEIVMISGLVQNKYCIDKQIPKPPFQQHFCSKFCYLVYFGNQITNEQKKLYRYHQRWHPLTVQHKTIFDSCQTVETLKHR